MEHTYTHTHTHTHTHHHHHHDYHHHHHHHPSAGAVDNLEPTGGWEPFGACADGAICAACRNQTSPRSGVFATPDGVPVLAAGTGMSVRAKKSGDVYVSGGYFS